ncbi:hypothetical protein WJX74_010952 [Apatococcus lobatus]|uniref:Uncharacterized protein n=1 Tax=Apatococcus lobatus TaxID=904363 RepID=A0AAW1QUZ6_9CHLO
MACDHQGQGCKNEEGSEGVKQATFSFPVYWVHFAWLARCRCASQFPHNSEGGQPGPAAARSHAYKKSLLSRINIPDSKELSVTTASRKGLLGFAPIDFDRAGIPVQLPGLCLISVYEHRLKKRSQPGMVVALCRWLWLESASSRELSRVNILPHIPAHQMQAATQHARSNDACRDIDKKPLESKVALFDVCLWAMERESDHQFCSTDH